jgi:nitrite reductase/ring-hydroxylating ferredoxin subunit
LGAAGLAVTGAAAYLGGHLVFAKAVMVSRVAGADGPRRWVRVIEEPELPDDVPTGVQADGRQILLYRHDGTLYALDNLCSHAGRPAQSRLRRGPDRNLPAARFAVLPGRRLRPARPVTSAAARDTRPGPQRLDRGAW